MFVTYLDRLYDPIDSLTTLAKTFQEHALSVSRALGLLATADTEPAGIPLRPGPGASNSATCGSAMCRSARCCTGSPSSSSLVP